MSYGRNGRTEVNTKTPNQQKPFKGSPSAEIEMSPEGEPQIRVDGFEQVLEMLKIADPAFRESLLRRLGDRDYELAQSLRADLRKMGL